jgi:hypothetical protein
MQVPEHFVFAGPCVSGPSCYSPSVGVLPFMWHTRFHTRVDRQVKLSESFCPRPKLHSFFMALCRRARKLSRSRARLGVVAKRKRILIVPPYRILYCNLT